jgi:hypothetical protein
VAVGEGWEVTWFDEREGRGGQVVLLAPFLSFLPCSGPACLSVYLGSTREEN